MPPIAPLPAPRYGMIGTPGVHFHAYNTLIRSSGLDRTISTARAFTDGAFPSLTDAVDTDGAAANTTGLPDGEQVVPVYSLGEDPLIRAYTQCPAYVARLQDWYASQEFSDKTAATAPLRDSVAALSPSLNTSLANWYNVWDGFLVNRQYGVGNTMPALSDTDFAAMQDLAYWLETAKMRSNLTGNLLSGLLLGDIVSKLQAAEANSAVPGAPFHRLAHISSHYNVQLGLLGVLAVDQSPEAANVTWLRKIPEFASIMVFELHTDESTSPTTFAVRLVIQDGPAAAYETVPLPCAAPGDAAEALAGPGSCTLSTFLSYADAQTFEATADWCTACSNSVWPACGIAGLQASLADAELGGSSCSSSSAAGWQLALAAILPALAVAAIAAALFIVYRKKVLQEAAAAASHPKLMSSGGVADSSHSAWTSAV